MKTIKRDIRVATPADIREYYGAPLPYSVRALVLAVDGKVVGVGGIAYREGLKYAFMELKDEVRPRRVTIGRFAKALVETFGGRGPGMTIAEPDEPMSDKLLMWLGFEYVGPVPQGEVYQWPG